MTEQHRIVVIGAGYAGLSAARRFAKKNRDARVIVVDARTHFVERVRLHQRATGQEVPTWDIAKDLGRKGIEFVHARVTAIDTERRHLVLTPAEPAGPTVIAYDTLIYALGSVGQAQGVSGASEFAYSVSTPEDVDRMLRVEAPRRVAVVGNGSTGIELATELAQARPGTEVMLFGSEEPGAWLSDRAKTHIASTLLGLGVDSYAQVKVIEVTERGVRLADGRFVEADMTVWTAGFGVPDLARRAGLSVDAAGRVHTDETLRSVSHPQVYAAGDSAVVLGADGKQLRMACATALPEGKYAADVITARVQGKPVPRFKFRFVVQCVSLGRHDAVIQVLRSDDSPRRFALTGRPAGWVKEQVVLGAARAVRIR